MSHLIYKGLFSAHPLLLHFVDLIVDDVEVRMQDLLLEVGQAQIDVRLELAQRESQELSRLEKLFGPPCYSLQLLLASLVVQLPGLLLFLELRC